MSSQYNQRTWIISEKQPKSIIMYKLYTHTCNSSLLFQFVFSFIFLLNIPIMQKVKRFLKEYISIHYSKNMLEDFYKQALKESHWC